MIKTATLSSIGRLFAYCTITLVLSGQIANAQNTTGEQPVEPKQAEIAVEPAPPPPLGDMELAIRGRIEIDDGSDGGDGADQRLLTLYSFYENRRYDPIWVTVDGPTAKAREFVDILENSALDALHPGDYRIDQLKAQLAAKVAPQLASLEIALSKTLLEYSQHLSAGRVEPHKINSEINMFPEAESAAAVLNGADAVGDIGTYVRTLAPQTANYSRLRIALEAFRDKAAHGDWTKIPEGTTVKPNQDYPDLVPILRIRMVESEDLKEGMHTGTIYDGELVAAVKNFQYRHGLDIDGVIGPATIAAMNVSLSTRVQQMELNMERRRWMEDDLGRSYIFVNLADQYLKFVRNDKTVHTTLLVVGKSFHRTPVFSKNMTYAVINPYWNVPYSIAVNEYLPKLKRNAGALTAQNIRVLSGGNVISPHSVDWQAYGRGKFPFRLRQDPGSKNALGRVKFMFPNRFNVYLHDTPSKSLFSKAQRIFSHGCMRVQNPLDLADVLLQADGWNRQKIDAAVAAGKKRVVKLSTPIPVHVTYLTAWVNKDGSVHFRDDVYGRDKLLATALTRVQKTTE